MEKRRIVSPTVFDLMKGLGIIMVLLRHSIIEEVGGTLFWKIAMSVLMPVFFVTSGFWMKSKDVSAGVKSSVEYVLRPYLYTVGVIVLIGLIHRWITGNLSEWLNLFLIPSILVYSGANTRIGAMWFVFALFLAWCLFYYIVRIKDTKMQWMAAVAMAFAGCALLKIKAPFQLGQGLIAAFFVYSGYFCKKQKLFEKKNNIVVMILMFALWITSIIYGSMDLAFYDVKYGFFSVLGSLCGSVIVIMFFLWLNRFDNPVFDLFRTVGRYTMWILCIHSVEAAVVPWKILFRFVEQQSVLGIVMHLVFRSVIIFIGCLCLKEIQKRKMSIIRR